MVLFFKTPKCALILLNSTVFWRSFTASTAERMLS